MRSIATGRKRILGEKAARFSRVGLARRCGPGRFRAVGFIRSWSFFPHLFYLRYFRFVAAFFFFFFNCNIYIPFKAQRLDGLYTSIWRYIYYYYQNQSFFDLDLGRFRPALLHCIVYSNRLSLSLSVNFGLASRLVSSRRLLFCFSFFPLPRSQLEGSLYLFIYSLLSGSLFFFFFFALADLTLPYLTCFIYLSIYLSIYPSIVLHPTLDSRT